MALKIIAAVAENGAIGIEGRIPWHLPGDLARFKELTMGTTVVQGHKTLGSIVGRLQKPLPGRHNIVLTHRPDSIRIDGVEVLSDFDRVIELARSRDVFVIGGSEIYKLALPVADEMFITRVLAAPKGDVFFPDWDRKEWSRVGSELRPKDEKNEFDAIFERYVRRSARYIEMKNIRSPVQMKDMQEILEQGVCPFCRDFGDNASDPQWHTQPVLWSGNHWVVTRNKYPYPWAKEWGDQKVHLLLVLKRHAESAAEIPAGAWDELGSVLRWAENEFNIEGGGFFLRFGEPIWTGGTIRHIHAHIAQRKDLETPAAFFLSEFAPVGAKTES